MPASYLATTTVECYSPRSAAAGAVAVAVTANGQDWSAGTDTEFRYTGSYSVGHLDPSSGPASGGTKVTVIGSGFDASAAVKVRPTLLS